MMTFDPRTIATPVYETLTKLRSRFNPEANDSESEKQAKNERLRQQKGQAVELYTYLSTWGMMRLKAEEKALKNQEGKQEVVKQYFACLKKLAKSPNTRNLDSDEGLRELTDLDTDEYLGLTGLGLALAQEFSFWATAIYQDIKENN
ncbi:hypothetical protein [Lyngbya aestuarii]|uniref:hypothetical protein n=1 Tax=Lyngbya aestuarii TaxID=118322 RepID=UPI00403D8E6D